VNRIEQLGQQLPQRIAVFRALPGLGDFLCVIPALRSLRTAFPHAEITLISLANIKGLVERFSQYVEHLLEFPGYPGLPEQSPQLQHIPEFFAAAQSKGFDLAMQMHGSGIITNPLTILLGARLNTGFYLPGQYCPDSDRFLPYFEHVSEVRRYLRLITFLGIPTQGEELEFPLGDEDWRALEAIADVHDLHQTDYVCIHPGASVPDRCWSFDQFAVVADALAARGLQVVLTGSIEEVGLATAVAAAMQTSALNLAGQTSLGALAALLQGAQLLVCNDTGVSHLAAALQVPSVVIFTNSDPQRWAPLNRDRHRVVCHRTSATTEVVIAQAENLVTLK
jgi:ADP-heptose:LPS heptosyltransferase